MTTYFADIIPSIQRFSKRLDDLTLLTDQHWVCVDHISDIKTIYIFRPSGELLISMNGKVNKGKWQYLGNNSLLIDLNSESLLFKHGFFDGNVLALKIDSSNEYAVFVNENKSTDNLDSIDNVVKFLKKKYSNTTVNRLPKTVKRNEINLGGYKYDTSPETLILILVIVIVLILFSGLIKNNMLGS